MACQYRVTLSGIKGFYRVYRMSATSTLYAFHKQMRADMEFPADQLILFKGLDAEGNVVARYGLFDLGDGAADQVTMAQTLQKGIVSFVYFYDVTNKKSVEIAFEGEAVPGPDENGSPVIVSSKGPNPIAFENGYVAYEDLPEDQKHIHRQTASLLGGDDEDEDFDEDEEDPEEEEDDDEDGKEIYDGSDPI